MKLVGKCKELEYCIIVYRPFQQQFMRIKAQKWGVNKVLFEKQPVPARETRRFWSSTVLCCISSCNLLFLNISELVPVVLCPELLHRFYLLNWWNLILFFFPPHPLDFSITSWWSFWVIWLWSWFEKQRCFFFLSSFSDQKNQACLLTCSFQPGMK